YRSRKGGRRRPPPHLVSPPPPADLPRGGAPRPARRSSPPSGDGAAAAPAPAGDRGGGGQPRGRHPPEAARASAGRRNFLAGVGGRAGNPQGPEERRRPPLPGTAGERDAVGRAFAESFGRGGRRALVEARAMKDANRHRPSPRSLPGAPGSPGDPGSDIRGPHALSGGPRSSRAGRPG